MQRICPSCQKLTDAMVCPDEGIMTVPRGAVRERRLDSVRQRLGQVFAGRYRLDRVLGSGGMGTVYEAQQLSVARPVALKLIRPERTTSTHAVARLEREARVIAQLRHPNIVQLIDYGAAQEAGNPTPYLVMELVEGISLRQILRRGTRLGLGQIAALAGQLLSALATAHDAGVVHRDLKPENLAVTRDGDGQITLKVLDFGVAQLTDLPDDARITHTGVAVGSPRYMAPEQAAGAATGPRTDLYAVGILLYELLTGAVPRWDGSKRDPIAGWPSTPLDPLMQQCLLRHPDKRPASARQALRMLEEAVRTTADTTSWREISPRSQPAPPLPTGASDTGMTTAWSLTQNGELAGLLAASSSEVLSDSWLSATGTWDQTPPQGVGLSPPPHDLVPAIAQQHPPLRRSKRWVSWAAVAALAAVVLGGLVWTLGQQGDRQLQASAVALSALQLGILAPPDLKAGAGAEASPEPGSPVAPKTRWLDSSPTGAEVWQDSEMVGQTPHPMEGAQGAGIVVLRLEGHAALTVDLDALVRSEDPTQDRITVSLSPLDPTPDATERARAKRPSKAARRALRSAYDDRYEAMK